VELCGKNLVHCKSLEATAPCPSRLDWRLYLVSLFCIEKLPVPCMNYLVLCVSSFL
jgi:hypothetical protein